MVLDDRFVELVAEGFDLAIRIGTLADSSLKARKLAETRMVIVAAPAYLAEAGTPRDDRRPRRAPAPPLLAARRPAISGGCAALRARSGRSGSAAG